MSEYWDLCTHEEPWFQHHLPFIAEEMFPQLEVVQPGVGKVLVSFFIYFSHLAPQPPPRD
eukprot:8271553-Karenia_brevis.AAC.1